MEEALVNQEEERVIVAREYSTTTNLVSDDEGFWKATTTIKDKVLFKDATEWVEETVDAMSIDRDPQNAIQTALGSALRYMFTNVYQSNFNGLVEYREYERALKNAKSLQPNAS